MRKRGLVLVLCVILTALLVPAGITAAATNHPPNVDHIGNKSINEGQTLTFTVTAHDQDVGQTLTYSASNLPTGATFDPNTQVFAWTPNYHQAGTYKNVTFTATDNGHPPRSDSEAITITVGNVNEPPVIDPIGDKTVNEGEMLTFTVTATDPDAGQTLTYSASNLPTGASFNTVTHTFTWTPNYNQAGSYANVLFTVTDNGVPPQSGQQAITIHVGDVNRTPALDPIGSRTVNEGETLTFIVTGSDPDAGQTLTYSASNLPTGASFDPVTQTFTWTPDYGRAGNYQNVLFTVTDNGTPLLSKSEAMTITVADVNRPPVLYPIGNKTVSEGETLTFTVTAGDPDGGQALAYAASNLPGGACFDPVTQTFTWTPDYGQAGNYQNILFTVTDNGIPPASASEAITITVGDVNRPPILGPIGSKTVDEGGTLTFTVTGTDPDGNGLTFTAANLPTGASFDPLTQTFTWTPDFSQAGSYQNVLFTVTDNGTPPLNAQEAVTISVANVNRPPVLNPIGSKTVDEGQTLTFVVTGGDPDGNGLTYAAANLPPGASFDPLTQTFTWAPDFSQAGSYQNVLFTVTDDGTPPLSDQEAITITVADVNRPPVLNAIGNKAVNEGQPLTFVITATDPDSGQTLSYTASNLPTGATFDADTHTFTWTPDYDEAGSYQNVLFTVTDNGTPPLSASEAITITVGDVNRPPVLSPIGSKTVNEDETLSFMLNGSDPDSGQTLSYTASNLPQGASFDETTRTFTWTPDYSQSGSYQNVLFTVTDNGTPPMAAYEAITITVGNVNRPPVLNPIGSKTVNEDQTLTFTVTGSDPDGNALTYAASNLPSGATFNPATQTFTWTPDYSQAGNYQGVLFTVTDDGTPPLSAQEAITISVGDVNRPPRLNPIGNKSVYRGQTLTFTVTGSDPDGGQTLTYAASNLPPGASFNPATQTFTWAPGSGQAGSFPNVVFTVTDDGTPAVSASETISLNVPNRAPSAPANPYPANGVTGASDRPQLTWTCSDPDGDPLTYDVYLGTSPTTLSRLFSNLPGTWYLTAKLLANTTYWWQIVAKDAFGGVTTGPAWSFTTGIFPYINSLSLTTAKPSYMITIYGWDFGAVAGQVKLGTKTMTINSWSDTLIMATVPSAQNWTSLPQTLPVKVQPSGTTVWSNSINLNITW